VVPFDPVAEALRPQSAHKVKKPKAFYIESVMEIRQTQYHGGGAGDGLGVDIQVRRLARRPDVLAARGVELSTSRVRPRR
jgi:hypothetical protein